MLHPYHTLRKQSLAAQFEATSKALWPGATPAELAGAKQAFMLGALSYHGILMGGTSQGTGEPTDDDLALMERISLEIDEFAVGILPVIMAGMQVDGRA